jgi:hypothetical protein
MFHEILYRLGNDEIFALSLMALMGVVVIVTFVAYQVRKMWQAEIDGKLKRTMLEQGMSAQEIKTVLGASVSSPGANEPPPPIKDCADLRAEARKFSDTMEAFARDRMRKVLHRVARRL